jgi:hypothetical protein
MKIELHKDGDNMAIVSRCESEEDFTSAFVSALAEMIEAETHKGDWEFQLSFWLRHYAEICCAYRGYKASVTKRTEIICGDVVPNSRSAYVDERNRVHIYDEPKGEHSNPMKVVLHSS